MHWADKRTCSRGSSRRSGSAQRAACEASEATASSAATARPAQLGHGVFRGLSDPLRTRQDPAGPGRQRAAARRHVNAAHRKKRKTRNRKPFALCDSALCLERWRNARVPALLCGARGGGGTVALVYYSFWTGGELPVSESSCRNRTPVPQPQPPCLTSKISQTSRPLDGQTDGQTGGGRRWEVSTGETTTQGTAGKPLRREAISRVGRALPRDACKLNKTVRLWLLLGQVRWGRWRRSGEPFCSSTTLN